MDDFDRSVAPPERLQSLSTRKAGRIGRGYTRFVRAMRILLPLAAVGLVAVVITWPDMEKRVDPMKKEDLIPDTANMQNELLQPKFESIDAKNQPYTVTADTATQSRENPDIVNLDKPAGSMTMNDGGIVAIQALTGIYEQKDEKLFLKGDVKLMNDTGYTLESDEMRVNLKTSEAFSDKDVHVQGPDGTIEATGMEAFSDKGLLIFKGPATMILTQASQSLSLDGSVPR
jgi:lipopolysaccharide export system protein LptC